jgi:hypothetical protein
MKNKKQLLGGVIAAGMLMSAVSAFAMDANVATNTVPVMKTEKMVTHRKHTVKSTSTEMVKKPEVKEVKDDMKASSTDMMKKKEIKVKTHKAPKTHKMDATTTPVMAH